MSGSELLQAIHDAEQEALVPKELRDQGWVYRDWPGTLSHEMWDLLLSIFGEAGRDYQILIMSESKKHDWIRGQFLLSPKALENIRNYATRS